MKTKHLISGIWRALSGYDSDIPARVQLPGTSASVEIADASLDYINGERVLLVKPDSKEFKAWFSAQIADASEEAYEMGKEKGEKEGYQRGSGDALENYRAQHRRIR